MATTVARLEAVLGADTGQFDRAMDRSHSRMGRVGKAAGVLGLGLAGGLAIGFKSSVKQAMEAEQVQARLEKSFKAAHLSIEPYRKSIEKADSATRNLGFSDEEAKKSLGSLIIATGSYRKAQTDVNVAMDIARFKGVSLEAATKMLTMAMAGSQRATKQLGLSVQASTVNADAAKKAFDRHKDAINAQYDALGKLTPAQEKEKQAALDAAETQYKGAKAVAQMSDKQVTAGKVIDLVTEKVHGQKEAYAKTAAGGIEIMKAKSDELKEQLGKALLPAMESITDALNKMLEQGLKHPKMLKAIVIGLVALTAALLTASAAQWALNVAVAANPYVILALAILALAAAFVVLYQKVQQLRPALEFLVETFVGLPLPLRLILAAMGGVHGAAEKLHTPIMKLADAFHTVVNWLEKVKDLFGWIIDNAKKIGGVFGGIKDAAGKIPGIGDVDPNKFKSVFAGGGGTGPKSINPALYDELSRAQQMGLHLTSGYRPGAVTKHGTRSDHSIYPSKAIDVADGPSSMARFFLSLIGDRGVKQAFYDPLGSIFGGVLNSYREGGHSDHVHVATYDQGGWLKPGWNLAFNGTGAPEPVGNVGNINLYVDGQKLFSWIKNTERRNNRRNSR